MTGNADDQRGEDQRGDDRADQTQEDLAEDPQRDRGVREIVADFGAGDHADEIQTVSDLRRAAQTASAAMMAQRRSIGAACYTAIFVPPTLALRATAR